MRDASRAERKQIIAERQALNPGSKIDKYGNIVTESVGNATSDKKGVD
jgi:hypothetical protein